MRCCAGTANSSPRMRAKPVRYVAAAVCFVCGNWLRPMPSQLPFWQETYCSFSDCVFATRPHEHEEYLGLRKKDTFEGGHNVYRF